MRYFVHNGSKDIWPRMAPLETCTLCPVYWNIVHCSPFVMYCFDLGSVDHARSLQFKITSLALKKSYDFPGAS